MPGRRRSFDRDDALAVARDTFWREGYDGASVARLTAAMGINPPSLYAAFGDKQRLFDEATDLYLARYDAGVHACLQRPTTRDAVAELLHRAALAHTDPGRPPGCLVLSEPRLAGERERLGARIADRIRRGQADGDVPAAVDPAALAAYLMAVLVGMSARARDGADRAELQQTARLGARALG